MIASEPQQEREGETKSPVTDKPYLQIVTEHFDGAPTATPGEVIQITGTNFPRDTVLEIVIDRRPVHDKALVDGQGTLRVQIDAPQEIGLHSLEIRLADGQKTVLDGSMFLVKHIDEENLDKMKTR